MSAQATTNPQSPLALPAPADAEPAEQIAVDGTQTFKFDKLGPVVVNTDGVRVRELVCHCRQR